MTTAAQPDLHNAVSRVAFSELQFSKLFRGYCEEDPAVWEYFPAGTGFADAERNALRNATASSADRGLLESALLDQNRSWGCDEATLQNIRSLGKPGSVCAVTGQQLGLFVSPLYTVFKAITAIQLAAKWVKDGYDAVPVFWLADEDHDFPEVATTNIPTGDVLARVGFPSDNHRIPVGRRVLDDRVSMVEEALADALPAVSFRERVLSVVHDTYQPGVSHRDAFASLLLRLLPGSGLVLVSSDDARMKRAVASVFQKEVVDTTLHEALVARTDKLAEAFHAQVKPRDTNLFYLGTGDRLAINRSDSVFSDGLNSWTAESLSAEIEAHPERFSPNVVLRPVMQDTLLPTAAYVAGPGELAYFAQLAPAYARQGVAMPMIYPRASATLLDGSTERLMDKRGLTLADLRGVSGEYFSDTVRRDMSPRVHEDFSAARRDVEEIVDRIKAVATEVESTLARSSEATRARMLREIDRLLEKTERAERRHRDELRRRLMHVETITFPAGIPQERSVSPLYFLARYGTGLYTRLLEVLSLDTRSHQVVRLNEI